MVRRSSPDAPQGIVPVLVLLGALAVVIALTAGSIGSAGGGERTSTGDPSAKRGHEKGVDGVADTRPTTTLIYGQTTLFVATTTPYTTTSSTTTTSTLPSKRTLSVRPPSVTFAAGSRSASFTVRTTSTASVSFFVIGVPDGITANPATGRVTRSKAVQVNLTIEDLTAAQSGVLTVVGTDGSQIRVPVTVPGSSFAVSSVAFLPSPPSCNLATQISVAITGDVATAVTVDLDSWGNGTSPLSLLSIGNGTWLGTLPAASLGSTLSGTVNAVSASGRSAQRSFSATVVGGSGC